MILTMSTCDTPAGKLTEAELMARVEPILDILAAYRQRAAAYDAVCRQIGFTRHRTLWLASETTRQADLPM